jgi:hypothetical protein
MFLDGRKCAKAGARRLPLSPIQVSRWLSALADDPLTPIKGSLARIAVHPFPKA